MDEKQINRVPLEESVTPSLEKIHRAIGDARYWLGSSNWPLLAKNHTERKTLIELVKEELL